jgi:hypothetical protein
MRCASIGNIQSSEINTAKLLVAVKQMALLNVLLVMQSRFHVYLYL